MYFSATPGTTPEYVGVYLLLEKVGYGPHRVGLARMTPQCRGRELNGGWAWHNDPASFGDFSPNVVVDQFQNEFGMGERPILAYPPGESTSQAMRDYFVDTATGFLPQLYRFLWHNMTAPDGLESHVDLGSFADYILHTELSLNVDAYRRSTYFFKDRDQPINAGPVWDLNLAYGNGARREFHDWIFPQYTYWKRLMCNYKLTSLVIQRWRKLRSDGQPWSDAAILAFLDASAQPLRRQLAKCHGDWRSNVAQCAAVDLETCSGTYESRVDDLKQAVLQRARWMDAHITQLYKPLDGRTCSFVGALPKYNCAANGDDDGCLRDPEKYYNAVAFPAVRKPYDGPECGAGGAGGESLAIAAEATRPSVDYCWLSSGVKSLYPREKGVRDKTLTPFCGGYGECAQGPGTKCQCKPGIALDPVSCERIDAEYTALKHAKAVATQDFAKDSSAATNSAALQPSMAVVVGAAMLVVVLGVAWKTAQHRRRERGLLVTHRPTVYGTITSGLPRVV
ncbi:hypothetical protein PINS_up009697 [Pythium insidiosum]|nr:hypothetical protein PINS_up009697 [Pythium insidiosum]